MIKVAILTISDRGARGEREDASGPAIKELIDRIDAQIESYEIIPDELDLIEKKLLELIQRVDLILTSGGTGLSPRDVTPDATRKVIHYEIPGFAEAMRSEGFKITPYAMLSRAVSGVREGTLIINLPGSPKAVRENLEVVLPVIPHAIEKIKGSTKECAT